MLPALRASGGSGPRRPWPRRWPRGTRIDGPRTDAGAPVGGRQRGRGPRSVAPPVGGGSRRPRVGRIGLGRSRRDRCRTATDRCAAERRVAAERCGLAVRARAGATGSRHAARGPADLRRPHDARPKPRQRSRTHARSAARRRPRRPGSGAPTTASKSTEEAEAAARDWLDRDQRDQQRGRPDRGGHREARDGPRPRPSGRGSNASPRGRRRADRRGGRRGRVPRRPPGPRRLRRAVAAGGHRRTGAAGTLDRTPDPVRSTRTRAARHGAQRRWHADDLPAPAWRSTGPDRARATTRPATTPRAARRGRRPHAAWSTRSSPSASRPAALEFPADHPFWGAFTLRQDREIAQALASLGHRFDGLGGLVDDRVPSQRDLSLALGYAGLDPMRIRHWPTETGDGRAVPAT